MEVKGRKINLHFPRRPSVTRHPILGRRQRWNERDGMFRIERFPEEGSGLFIVLSQIRGELKPVGQRRTLGAALALCRGIVRESLRALLESHAKTPRRKAAK